MNPRQLAKASLEGALTVTGVAAAARKLRRDHVAILAYHNVVPDHEAGPGDASLHLPLSRFLAQLDALQETHDFVDLPTAIAGGGDRIRATVTFDDAYRGAVRLALPELRKRGIPATVFVCPGLLDEPGLWWDETAEAGRLTPDARARAMYEHRGELDAVRQWAFGRERPPTLPDTFGVASEAELLDQVRDGIAVGGHAWAHACLPALATDVLRADLDRTLEWLRSYPGPTVPWLALPYGEGTPDVAAAALDVGYEGVLEIRGGLCGFPPDPAAIPRINVPAGLSSRGLVLRASGVWK